MNNKLEGVVVDLPSIGERFEFRSHPEEEQIREGVDSWMRSVGAEFIDSAQLDRFIEQNHSKWTSYTQPECDVKRCILSARIFNWIFLADNVHALITSRTAARAIDDYNRFREALNDGSDGSGLPPMWRITVEAWRDLTDDMTPAQRERATGYFDRMMVNWRREAEWVSAGPDELPTLEEFLPVRYWAGGIAWSIALTEYGLGLDMAHLLQRHPLLAELEETTVWHVTLANDIHSLRQEVLVKEGHNSVWVQARGRAENLGSAIAIQVDRLRALESEWFATRDNILCSAVRELPDVQRWIRGLEFLLSGNMRWGMSATRYHGPDWTWDGRLSARWLMTRDRTVAVPG
ncbi:terpene synthase family protein [Streptomyces chartreusis]